MTRIVIGLLLIISSAGFSQTYLGPELRVVYDIDVQGNKLCAITETTVELWDILKMTMIQSADHKLTGIPTAISFGGDSATVAFGSRAGELGVLNFKSREPKMLLTSGSQGPVTSVDVNVEKNLVAAGFMKKKLSIYDLVRGNELFSHSTSKDVTAVKFSDDGKFLFTGDDNGELLRTSTDSYTVTSISNKDSGITAIAMKADHEGLSFSTVNSIKSIKNALTTTGDSEIESADGHNGIVNIDHHYANANCFVFSTVAGKVVIVIPNGVHYTQSMSMLINQVRFLSDENQVFRIAVATRGHGLQVLKGTKMKIGR